MRIFGFLFFILGIFCLPLESEALTLSDNYIEFDFNSKEIKFVDFALGDYKISGNFCFDVVNSDGSLIFNLEGEDIALGKKEFTWVKAKLIKREDKFALSYFSSPEFVVKGDFDPGSKELNLNIDIDSQQKFSALEGKMKGRVSIWGVLGSLLATGNLTIEEGRYADMEFVSMFLNFLGKPPLLNLTDSSVTLSDGSIYEIQGAINLVNLDSFWEEAEFIARRMYLNGWGLYSGNQGDAGFKKDIDEKFDISIGTKEGYGDAPDSGAELRYKLQKERFLKFHMKERETILGFENKKEF